jgi:hypothetical protein
MADIHHHRYEKITPVSKGNFSDEEDVPITGYNEPPPDKVYPPSLPERLRPSPDPSMDLIHGFI